MVSDLQRLLQRIYDVDVVHDVLDFLITDHCVAAALDAGGRRTAEKLLIHEAEDGVDVALFLERALLERLEASRPDDWVGGERLGDFWTVLEGVSHFVYFAYKAHSDREVSLLELELQAEVDKFIATQELAREHGASPPDDLHRWLFERPRLDPALDDAERARYRDANRFAARYCLGLERRYRRPEQRRAMAAELRAFYRMPQHEKIRASDRGH
jgi:hypothetical protein